MPQIITGQDAEAAFAAAGGAAEQATVTQAKADMVAEAQENGELQEEQQVGQIESQAPILGKFKSQADLEKAYVELEKKLGSKQQAQAEPEAGDADEAEDEDDASQPDGVSEEQAQAVAKAVLDAAGGQENFQRLAAWAKVNGDPSTVATFNDALEKGNAAVAGTVLKALRYDYMQANGYEPQLLGGSQGGGTNQPFRSEREVQAAMNDPRYMGPDADPAYIRDVQSRLAISENVFRTS